MKLKDNEIEIEKAANGYLFSQNGEREKRMGILTELAIAYLENGGSIERLNELVNKEARKGE